MLDHIEKQNDIGIRQLGRKAFSAEVAANFFMFQRWFGSEFPVDNADTTTLTGKQLIGDPSIAPPDVQNLGTRWNQAKGLFV